MPFYTPHHIYCLTFIFTHLSSQIYPYIHCLTHYPPVPLQLSHIHPGTQIKLYTIYTPFYSILLHLLTFFCSFNPCPLPFNVIFILTSILLLFQVSHIDPGTPIKLYLYAENAKGTSDPAIIDDASLNQQKHYVEGKNMRLQGYHNIKI